MKQIKINDELSNKLKEITKKFKSYRYFSSNKECAYEYTKCIGIRICPYCNINYIPTIFEVTRPELDHFIAKSSEAGKNKKLDPDNLVPSCHTCNSTLKGKKEFTRDTHLHPFFDDFDAIMKFSINMVGGNIFDCKDFDIVFTPISKNTEDLNRANKNIEVFKLEKRYQNHKDIVKNHFYLISHYSKRKRQEISELFGFNDQDKLKNNNQDNIHLNTLVNTFMNSDINNTSLGKLIKDIYNTYLRNL